MSLRKFTAILFSVIASCFTVSTASAQEYLFKLRDDTVMLFNSEAELMTEECFSEETTLSEKLGVYKTDDIEIIKKYQEMGLLEFYEENGYAELLDMPNTSEYMTIASGVSDSAVPLGYSYNQINVQALWELGFTGKGITVAVIDSGVNAHTDIVDNLLQGYNFSLTEEQIAQDPSAVYKTQDIFRHGTMVAGLIAANGENYRGIAYEAKIVPLKCFRDSDGKADLDVLAEAMVAAVDDFHCDIINMSGGSGTNSRTLELAVEYVYSMGVPVVAAAGNSGSAYTTTDAYYYPASYDSVVSVANLQKDDTLKSSSQKNDRVDVSAPGTYIYGIDGNSVSGYITKTGTSFSCPIVTGIAVLMLQAEPTLTPSQVETLLRQTATDLGTAGYDMSYGYGKVNCDAIVKNLLDGRLYKSDIVEYKGTYNVAIRNGLSSLYNSFLAFANYDGNKMVDISAKHISLESGTYQVVSIKKSGAFTKFFELESGTLKPLIKNKLISNKQN